MNRLVQWWRVRVRASEALEERYEKALGFNIENTTVALALITAFMGMGLGMIYGSLLANTQTFLTGFDMGYMLFVGAIIAAIIYDTLSKDERAYRAQYKEVVREIEASE